MGGVYPCASNADIRGLLHSLPKGLCRPAVFCRAGAENRKVDVPLVLLTADSLTLLMADVGIAADDKIFCQAKSN